MKVRIIRSAYGKNNGRILDVTVNDVGDYVYGSGLNQLLILKKDAEVVEDVERSCETCGYTRPCGKVIRCNGSGDKYKLWIPNIETKSDCITGVGKNEPTGNSEIGSTYTATHYMIGNQQPIEIMQSLMSEEMFRGFLWGNVIKYSLRLNRKGKMREDAGKCLQYAEWLCDVMDGKKILPGGKV